MCKNTELSAWRAAGDSPNDTLDTPRTVWQPGISALTRSIASSVARPSRPRPQREGQGVEDEVGGRQPELVDRDSGDPLAHFNLAVGGAGLTFLVDGQHHHRRPELLGHRQQHVGLAPAVLQVDRVDDRTAADAAQTRRHHGHLGGVDHQRQRRLGGQAVDHLDHVGYAVPADVVDADVKGVRTLAHLGPGHLGHGLPVGVQQQVAELARPVGVEPLTDHEKRQVLLERHRRVQRGQCRLEFRLPRRRPQIGNGPHDRVEVLGSGAAAATDQLHTEVADELAVRGGQRLWGQRVGRLAVDH
jgi:hypothetical protein